jgi:short-subunit dehydrogenase
MQTKKHIVITGASSGIGHKLAEFYIQDGHAVALLSRRPPLLKKQNPDTLIITCDVTSNTSVQNAVQECLKKWKKIDLAIANAGISPPHPTTPMSLKQVEETYQVNLFGAARLFEAVIPHMIERKSGHLVSIASLAGLRGAPQAGPYCSSKAALIALTESLRLDLKPHGINVSLINPGFIKTPLTDQNQFKMPFLLSLEEGTKRIYHAIHCKKLIYAFPKRLAWLALLARLIPASLYDKIISNYKNNKKENSGITSD